MGTPTIRTALEVPGRLAWGCTDLTAAFPHGGTELGFVGQVAFEPGEGVQEITAEETGRVVEVVATITRPVLTAVLRDADDDALGHVFLNTSTGSTTGRTVVDIGGTNRAGYLYAGRSGVLVFTPESVIEGNDDVHRMVVFYKAVPHTQAQAKLALVLGTKEEIPVAFIGIEDSSGRLVKAGFRADLSLA